MNTHEAYSEYKKEMSKDAGKALAFFFLGIPAIFLMLTVFGALIF